MWHWCHGPCHSLKWQTSQRIQVISGWSELRKDCENQMQKQCLDLFYVCKLLIFNAAEYFNEHRLAYECASELCEQWHIYTYPDRKHLCCTHCLYPCFILMWYTQADAVLKQSNYTSSYKYIYLELPGTGLSSILGWKNPPKDGPGPPFKTRVIWVPRFSKWFIITPTSHIHK